MYIHHIYIIYEHIYIHMYSVYIDNAHTVIYIDVYIASEYIYTYSLGNMEDSKQAKQKNKILINLCGFLVL